MTSPITDHSFFPRCEMAYFESTCIKRTEIIAEPPPNRQKDGPTLEPFARRLRRGCGIATPIASSCPRPLHQTPLSEIILHGNRALCLCFFYILQQFLQPIRHVRFPWNHSRKPSGEGAPSRFVDRSPGPQSLAPPVSPGQEESTSKAQNDAEERGEVLVDPDV